MICWILDSGASINITNQLNKLQNIKKWNENVYLANNQLISTQFISDFIGYIDNCKFTINNVYYSPKINKNLLSIGMLTQQGYKIIFKNFNNKSYVIIYDQHSNRIQNIILDNINTFKLWISTHPFNLLNPKQSKFVNEINYKY